jgi:hypothetical protein
MGTVPYDEFVDILVATDTANLGRFGSIISIMNMDDSALPCAFRSLDGLMPQHSTCCTG